jgi:hypothetical protein
MLRYRRRKIKVLKGGYFPNYLKNDVPFSIKSMEGGLLVQLAFFIACPRQEKHR